MPCAELARRVERHVGGRVAELAPALVAMHDRRRRRRSASRAARWRRPTSPVASAARMRRGGDGLAALVQRVDDGDREAVPRALLGQELRRAARAPCRNESRSRSPRRGCRACSTSTRGRNPRRSCRRAPGRREAPACRRSPSAAASAAFSGAGVRRNSGRPEKKARGCGSKVSMMQATLRRSASASAAASTA